MNQDYEEVTVFVRYKPAYICEFNKNGYAIFKTIISQYLEWRRWLVEKNDNQYQQLVYSEVQLIKPKKHIEPAY